MTHFSDDVEIWYTIDGSSPVNGDDLSHTALLFETGSYLRILPMEPDSSVLSMIRTNPPETDSRGFGWLQPTSLKPIATTIRAVAKYPSGILSDENSGTWLVTHTVPDLPVISIIVDQAHLFSDTTGIYVPGLIYNEAGYGPNFWGFDNANYHQRGDEWERPARFEYYVEGSRVLSQQVGLRIHGGGSRALPMKSFRVYARSEYGTSTLDYPFFGPQNDDSFKRLILRNSGQDFAFRPTMIRDAIMQQAARNMDVITQDFQASVVYINGEFWGIHNIRERYDHHFFDRTTGIAQEDLDFLTFFGGVQEGDAMAFDELVFYFRNEDLTDEETYQLITDRMDISNFIDYKLLNIHFANLDWPGNNIDYFRYRGEPVPGHPYKDGRFRWVVYDMDAGLEEVDKNMIIHATEAGNADWPNPDWSTLFLRNLLLNEDFRDAFLKRYLHLLSTEFRPDVLNEIIDERQEAIRSVMPDHINRWGYPSDMEEWEEHIQRYRDFVGARTGHSVKHINEFFDTNIRHIRIDAPEESVRALVVDGVTLPSHSGYWVWYHVAGDPVTLQIIPEEEVHFTGWLRDGEVLSESTVLTINPMRSIRLELLFGNGDDTDEEELVHFWFFGDHLPNNTALNTISSWYSRVDGAGLHFTSALSAPLPDFPQAGIMDRVNDPTSVNYPAVSNVINSDLTSMRGIRARNPSEVADGDYIRQSSITLTVPTTGFRDITFGFAANRTANGQEQIELWYATDSTRTWIPFTDPQTGLALPEEYFAAFRFDFSDIEEMNDNPYAALKLTFAGDNRTGTEGNVRFNNMTLHGYDMTVSVDDRDVPQQFRLYGNFPNPFNPQTFISFRLDTDTHIRLQVFDLLGRQVATLVDAPLVKGRHDVLFDARNLSTGMYIYTIEMEGQVATGKMMLIR